MNLLYRIQFQMAKICYPKGFSYIYIYSIKIHAKALLPLKNNKKRKWFIIPTLSTFFIGIIIKTMH